MYTSYVRSVENLRISGYWYAALTSFTRSRALDTFELDNPVEFSKCVSAMPSAFAFAFIAAMNAGRPPG